jgi:hypothetical protein
MRGIEPCIHRREDNAGGLTIGLIVDDIDNQSAAFLAKTVDPNGERTIGENITSLSSIDG